MNIQHYQTRFTQNAGAIQGLVQTLESNQAMWKPKPKKWSVLEIVMHLWDEEREDFKQRLDYTLHHPGKAWPAIDPQGWVNARGYNQKNLPDAVAGFMTERDKSVHWLGTLRDPDWSLSYRHPKGWTVCAGDLLASWAVHDLLHLRQLTHILFLYEQQASPFSTEYAGVWPGEGR